jgi:hypothetical protein
MEMANMGRKIAAIALVMGLISFALGGFFVQQGFAKASMITEKMTEQNITYGSAGGSIAGAIDTPQEAQAMADILGEHAKQYGNYAELKKDDPNRQTILNAMTMSNSLEMAVMGFGLTDVVKASGAFMLLVGFTFIIIAIPGLSKN